MTTIRKKLIEVALPLEAINKASAREKSIRHGHPSTLHLWWARRPLAACMVLGTPLFLCFEFEYQAYDKYANLSPSSFFALVISPRKNPATVSPRPETQ